MPSNHLILCHPLLLLPSIFPSIRVFSKESVLCIRWPKYYYLRNANQKYNEVSPHTGQNGYHLKNLQTINAGEDMEKRETSCTVGGNVSWYSHCREQYGDSFPFFFWLFTAILCPLHFQVNFESTCQFPQHNSENYYCHCIDSIGHFGTNWHLSNIESFNEHGMLLHLFGSSLMSLDTVCSFQCRGPTPISLDFLIFCYYQWHC